MKPSSSSVLEATIAGVVRLAAVWSALVVGAFGRSAARAGTIWDGGGGDTNLTTAANWDDDSAPTFTGGTSTLTFGTGGSTATVDTAADLARIILDRDSAFAIANGSGSLTLQGEDVGGVLTGITASPATSGTTVAYTISESVALGATQSWNVANNGAGTTSLSVSGVISGAAPNLTKLGSGTLTLSGANTFTGSLTVAEGVLSINSWNNVSTNGPLGNSAANVVLGSATTAGTLRYTGAAVDPPATPRGIELAAGGGVIQLTGVGRNSGRVHISGSSISGSGPLTIDNPNGARFLIVGSSTFSGPVTVQAGELQLNLDPTTTLGGGSNGLGSAVTLNSGAVLTLWRNGGSSTVRLGSLAGGGTVRSESGGTQTLSVGGDDTSTTFSGVIQDSYSSLTGSIALTKVGSGTLTLSGSNTYSGDTTISAGRLELTGNGVLGSGSYAGTIANAGELVVGTDAAQILAGVISGTGSVTKSGAGTLTLSAANSFTGVVAINEGTVEVGSWNLSATNGVWGNQTNNPASPATTFIQMNGGRINYTGASASGNLRGVNLASGTNTIDVIGGATLSFGFSGGSSGWNRFQSNGGDLVKEGAGTLALGSDGVANNIFTGKASINSGTLEWWGGGSMPTPPTLVSDFLTINDGATFAMSFGTGSTVDANIGFNLVGNATVLSAGTSGTGHTIAGPIADGASAGSLIKTGAGVLTLSGSNSYTGSTTVSTGTLKLGSTGSLASSSAISVASGATFDVSSLAGGLTIAASQSLGGAGSIIGSLVFSGDSKLDFTSSLTVNSGTVTFNGFGIDDILGLDGTVVSAGTYTLLGGSATFDLTNAFNVGAGNAADIGGGKSAYLQAGSLQVVVVPEPGAFALAALGMAAVAHGCRRRRS